MNSHLETKPKKQTSSFQAANKDRQAEAFKQHLQEFSSEAQQGKANSNFQHDFSRVQVQGALPLLLRTDQTAACPSPRSCPTGGACHTCPARIQTKLTLNRPGDKYEQEADHMAAQMMQTPKSAGNPGLRETPVTAAPPNLQRLTENQTSAPPIPPLVNEVISSPGQPLDAATRAFAEPHFGHDFSQVRIHTGARAAQSSQALRAQAYTVGRNIVFGAGQYQPQVAAGRQLLVHELTHVVQQGGAENRHIQRQADGGAARGTAASTRPEREERFNIGRGGNRFDAEFNRRGCLLTLKMKVRFNFLASGGANSAERWPSPAAQQTWQNNFIRIVTNRWSYRYYLEPDSPCSDETCTRAYARVQVLPVTSNPHVTMNVAYTTDFEGSAVGRNRVSPAVGRRARMDALDVRQRTDIPQVPSEHEFGHMLGLPHVHCDRNDAVCYGVTAKEKADIMGTGSLISARDYRVFSEAMYYFNGCNWHPTHGTPSRAPMGDFPVPSGDTAMA